MKAVGYRNAGVIESENSLEDIELPMPEPEGSDLLVKVMAVSVNPVDTKVRKNRQPHGWGVLGYDASGIVESVGPNVHHFKPGDEVYYAGAIDRPGTNSEYHLVDERIVGRKPTRLTHAQAAALPLTAITAWEMLFDRLDVQKPTAQNGNLILVIGGAGGVGSIAIQLLRALTQLTIVATASRPQTQQWVRDCGAHHVVDHSKPLAEQFLKLGLGAPGFIFSTTETDRHYSEIVEMIAPQGRFGLIDDPGELNIKLLKQKSVSLHWEFMFARPLFNTPDIQNQSTLLNQVAALVDQNRIQTTLSEVAGCINAATLKQVHRQIESGTVRGKIVLEGFT